MWLIDNNAVHDPAWNLALEEYAVRHLDRSRPYLLFYVNRPAVIVGKHQNTIEEVNAEHITERGIEVVRRISGGGAVYHDHGNLNFSVIKEFQRGSLLRFEEFTGPVVRALRRLGVPAERTGRNDIVAGGRKISGNAQFTTAGRMFSHGTLLFDSDLDEVVAALRPPATKIESKGLKSIRSRVANISEFLDHPLTLEELRAEVTAEIFGAGEPPVYRLTPEDRARVDELAEAKYRRWDWNYGESPDFNLQKVHRFEIGQIDVRLDVHRGGHLEGAKIYGDFLGVGDTAELEALLVGAAYEPRALAAALAGVDVADWFGGLTNAEFVTFLYEGPTPPPR